MKSRNPASPAHVARRALPAGHSSLQAACQSGFGIIERSNLALPAHYLNPIFYMALLSAWASLGKTAPESHPVHPFPPTKSRGLHGGISPHCLACRAYQAPRAQDRC